MRCRFPLPQISGIRTRKTQAWPTWARCGRRWLATRKAARECPKTATIAIVGRPNVGKSTLFNRMTGKRTALVSDLPGLTRDRKEGDAEIWGHDVRWSIPPASRRRHPASIAARMRAQTETAIADADLVLFVIDARAGVTPVDQEFARIVRQAGNPSILVANKCEGSKGSEGFYEAYAAGPRRAGSHLRRARRGAERPLRRHRRGARPRDGRR